MKISYFIMTRFKLKFDSPKVDNEKTKSEEWFKNRMNKFEKFLYPSILNQSDQDFTWIGLSTDGHITSKEKRILESYDKLHNIYCINSNINEEVMDEYDDMPSSYDIRIGIKPFIKNKSDIIISTRIDTDDALHKDFVKNIKDKAIDIINDKTIKFPIIISPINGIVGYKKEFREVNNYYWNNKLANMFSSVVDKINKDTHLIYDHPHSRWHQYFKVTPIYNKHMFIHNIHEQNIFSSNKHVIRWVNNSNLKPVSNKIIMSEFGLDESIFNES